MTAPARSQQSQPLLSDRLHEARAQDSEQRRSRVVTALRQLQAEGRVLSISAVARAAGVHRSFLHRHPDLANAVREAATVVPSVDSPTTDASLHAELANAHASNRRLASYTKKLESRLSELLGREVAISAGILETGPDSGQLLRRVHDLEQLVTDLRNQLDEREDDLAAARAANRAAAPRGTAEHHRS